MTIKTIAAVGRLEFSLTVGAEVFKKKGRKEALHLLIKFAIKKNKVHFLCLLQLLAPCTIHPKLHHYRIILHSVCH
jgi:hypothetical protein